MSVFSFRSFLRYRFLVIFIMGALVCGCRPDQSSYRGNMVEISGSKGQWELVVNGKPFRLKGAGVSRISGKFEKADFLKLAKELGANTVRTWGIDQGTLEYLNKAQEYGLYVNAGPCSLHSLFSIIPHFLQKNLCLVAWPHFSQTG